MEPIIFDPGSGGACLPEHAAELLTALDQIFLSVVKLELDTGSARLLQSQGRQDWRPHAFDWDTYISFYRSVLEPEEAEKLTAAFSLRYLNQLWAVGSRQHRIDLACRPETGLD